MPPEDDTGIAPEAVQSNPVVHLTEDDLRKLAEIVLKMIADDLRVERERLGR